MLLHFQTPRAKIESIISKGGGEEDEDAPGVLAETRFWVVIQEDQLDEVKSSLSQTLNIRAKPSSSMAGHILDSDPLAGLGMRPRHSTPAPLNCEVLRAYDTYNTELAKAANVEPSP